jgi:MGT family glycosyltransferase
VFPAELDYVDRRPLDDTWHRLESSVRQTDPGFELPDSIAQGSPDSRLVYLSLGSLGSADVELMRRLVDVLANTPHRYVVSKGPQHDEYQLADNMWGREFLPQTRIIPMVDAVITHGGNNTVTEAMHFGKPMVVLPLFWDQYDNAQRIDETGYGVRLDTYRFSQADMDAALDLVLGDSSLRERARRAGDRVRASDGLRREADLIEAVEA